MDEKPDQIIDQIEAQREELGRNLNELETRVRRSTDWRTYYDRNPMLMLGAALGGGVLLGSMVAGASSRRSHSSHSSSSWRSTGAGVAGASAAGVSMASGTSSAASPRRVSGPATSIQKTRINETVDHMKAALIAFGISKAKEFVSQVIPGFEQHLEEAERSKQEHRSNVSSGYNYPSSSHSSPQEFRSHTESNPMRTEQPVGSSINS